MEGVLAFGVIGGLVSLAAMRAFTPSARVEAKQVTEAGGQWLRLQDGRPLEFEFGATISEATSTILALHGAMTTGKLWVAHALGLESKKCASLPLRCRAGVGANP